MFYTGLIHIVSHPSFKSVNKERQPTRRRSLRVVSLVSQIGVRCLQQACSPLPSPLDRNGRRGAISTYSSPALYVSAVCKPNRVNKLCLVHSCILSSQFFLWWHRLLLPCRATCRTVFKIVLCRVMWSAFVVSMSTLTTLPFQKLAVSGIRSFETLLKRNKHTQHTHISYIL